MATQPQRNRNYFIEINPGAQCYDNFKDLMNEYSSQCDFYAYIMHDKDTKDDGTPKLNHYHLVIDFINAKSLERVRKIFKGAHVLITQYEKSAVQYLIHKNNPEKAQYNTKDIITNDKDKVNDYINDTSNEYEPFNSHKILNYIAEGTRTYYSFFKRFGPYELNKIWKVYEHLLMLINMKDKEIMQDYNKILLETKTPIEQQLIDNKINYEIEETGEMVENE